MAQAGAETRPLPAEAHFRLRKLAPLLTAPTIPVPLAAAPLRRRLAFCQLQVQNIEFRLQYELPERAAVAMHRVAAETLPAALAAAEADAPMPPRRREDQQLTWDRLRNAALNELEDRSGPAPLALLRARLAGLRAEAEALTQALDAAGEPTAG
ncbi:hypothetical protein FDY95_09670 [Hymenobacter jeollabukensis]|uniref:Uncharacterized protein n=1 Tax=Hymenobacter jeollabukensis TaxID=2025313 RepID=A0A5R8WTM2_9BACT|nr:hypothetical protein FDY95_09670 [Hymenobacter jeollabukensis]